MGNPLAMVLSQLAGQGAPNQNPAPAPAAAPATTSPSPMAGLLTQAMQHLQSAPSAVPSPSPVVNSTVHPVVAKLIDTLANAAGAYGWTAMPPQEREQRMQLDQQKAETMARLAQAGVAQEQTSLWRGEQAETARQRAATAEENVQRQKERDQTLAQIQSDRVQVQRDMVAVRKNATEGRLLVAHQQLEQRASQFEQTLELRAKQVGIQQARIELGEQGNAIKQGFLDVARGALSQRGTVEADQVNQKLQEFTREHWLASEIFGFPDISTLTQQSQGAGIPGVAPPATGAAPVAATAPGPTSSPSPTGTPAKTAPRPKSSGTVIHYDRQGNRIQ